MFSLATIVLTILLLAVVCAIIIGIVRDRKKGKHPSCGGNCGSCPMGGTCHKSE